MSKHKIAFSLNDTEQIVLELEESLDNIHCCSEAPIVLIKDIQRIFLVDDDIRNNMQILHTLLSKALENKLRLHASITADIGFLYNEELQNKPGLSYTKLEGRDYWVGNKNNLWSPCIVKGNLTTWIYNDTDGAIIFEVTPVYPYHFSDPNEEINFIPYEEWIKDYKPYFIKTIPYSVAQQWLEQANSILKVIEKNIERERATHKDNRT